MKSYKAFTLAEVLITLGIIGVVAAMTMPTLINKIDNKVLESQNKKAQSILANGIKSLMANEDVTTIANSSLSSCSTAQCVSDELHKVFKIVGDVPVDDSDDAKGEYKFTNGTFPIWTDSNMYYSFVTPDGMYFGIKKFEPGASSFTFVADLNGSKNPNTGAKDLCKYTVSATGTLVDSCSSMASCGGTAYNVAPKYYSWGMQSANAAPEISTSDGSNPCAAEFGDDAIFWGTGECFDGYEQKRTSDSPNYLCCVPVEKTTSCF